MISQLTQRGFSARILLAGVLLIGGIVLLVLDAAPVVLTWETASEVGTAGFNVYRAPAEDGTLSTDAFTQVNDGMVPAAGDELTGAEYRYDDDSVTPWRRYHYRIEEVEWDGATAIYPETVVVRAGLPSRWIKLEGGLLLVLAAFFALSRRRGDADTV